MTKLLRTSLTTWDWTIIVKRCMDTSKKIKIEVYGGCVTEVTGLPEGYDYEIVDHDHLEAEQDASS